MIRFKLTSKEYLLPFILITSLFFLWGLAHGMLDTLNKHFQEILQISKFKSGLIQFAMYSAYFGMALPAGFFMRKYGYKQGVILGLALFAAGSILIAATTPLESFWVFLGCLFVMGCGLATLETAANPYTTKLGPAESAEQRINFSQSFNGLAWVIGPMIGMFIYGNNTSVSGEKLSSMFLPYLAIGIIVLGVAFIFYKTELPEIAEEIIRTDSKKALPTKPLHKQKHFVNGVVAQFLYVAAQTGIFSYLINFVTDEGQYPRFDLQSGPLFLSIGFALFMVGRMSGSYLMGVFKPHLILATYAAMSVALLPLVSLNLGVVSLVALYAVFFFMSVMFPTIFALGIKGLGEQTKKASSFMVMSIVGGAVFPPLMGWVADEYGMSAGFLTPVPCFVFIVYYALKGHVFTDSKC